MRKQKIEDAFIAMRYKMLNSPAFSALSPCARLVLLRLQVEYTRSGGRENGDLICTYRQLRDWCCTSTQPIQDAIAELQALGFTKVKKGRSGTKGYGRSSQYGLTYLPKVGTDIAPTDDWAKFTTTEQVVRAKSRAKKHGKRPPPCARLGTRSTCAQVGTRSLHGPTFGCVQEMPVKHEIDVPVQAHDLDSSEPVPAPIDLALRRANRR
jgi:hypothetical protein